MEILTSDVIMNLIQDIIVAWHRESAGRSPDYVIVTDEIRRIRPLNEHRDDMEQVIRELVVTNTEMWHEEDKVRSMDDATVLRAIRNINPLNQHRNDLIEEIDEIVVDRAKEKKGE